MSQGSPFKKVQFWFGIIVSLGLIFWLAYSCNWQEVGRELINIRVWMILPAILIFMLHFMLRAMRWRLLLGAKEQQTSLSLLYDGMMVGNLATFVLPLRIGEFVRPYMISRCSEYSFATSFVSVVIERFFDLSTVLLAFAGMLFFLDRSSSVSPMVYDGAYFLAGVAGCILVFIMFAIYFPKQLIAIASVPLKYVPRTIRVVIQSFLNDFLAGVEVLKNGSILLQVIGWSLLIWASSFLRFWIALAAFPSIDPTIILSVSAGVIVSLAIAAPSAPGFVGVYEAGCIAAFALFGLSQDSATAYAIVTHLLEYILIVFFGLVALFRNDLKLGDLLSRNTACT